MKYCSEKWQQKVEAYSDNLLSEEEDLLVEEHLRTCDLCAESLAEQEQLLSVIRSLPQIPVSSDFDNKIISKIDRIQLEIRNPIFRYFEFFAVIFILLFGLITFLGFQLFKEINQEEINTEKVKLHHEATVALPDK